MAPGGGLNRLSIGIGMLPRGEVGLIFASIGKGLGVIDGQLVFGHRPDGGDHDGDLSLLAQVVAASRCERGSRVSIELKGYMECN